MKLKFFRLHNLVNISEGDGVAGVEQLVTSTRARRQHHMAAHPLGKGAEHQRQGACALAHRHLLEELGKCVARGQAKTTVDSGTCSTSSLSRHKLGACFSHGNHL